MLPKRQKAVHGTNWQHLAGEAVLQNTCLDTQRQAKSASAVSHFFVCAGLLEKIVLCSHFTRQWQSGSGDTNCALAESPKEVSSRDWKHLMGAALLESLALVHKDKPSTPQCEKSAAGVFALLREAWLAFARIFFS